MVLRKILKFLRLGVPAVGIVGIAWLWMQDEGRVALHLAMAWVISALMFPIVWIAIVRLFFVRTNETRPKFVAALMGAAGMFIVALYVQVIYGSVLFFGLSHFHEFTWIAVTAAYLVPIVLFGFLAANTTKDLTGTANYAACGLIVATCFWAIA